jgi:phage nucleotide-binding protein
VKKASDLKKPRSWAIYGRAGSGKTTLSSTFPKPILLIDVKDEGTDSIADVQGIDVLEVADWDDFEDAYWWLHENPKKYKTVVIDTVTQLQQLKIEEIGSKKSLKGKSIGDWGTMTKQDWGEVASAMKTWITNYRDLPLETVFLAQDRVFNGEEDAGDAGEINPEVGPRLSPSVQSHLCAAVSVVANTFVRSRTETVKKKINGKEKVTHKEVVEYCLRLGPNQSYITKFRKPKKVTLADFLVDPDYDSILELISGE